MLHNTIIKIVACVLAISGLATAKAQNITGYRYWFNDDVATATIVDLPPSTVTDQTFTLSSNTLPVGHHLVTLQFRDADGTWSAPWTSHFTQRGTTVSALEYWFNDEPSGSTTVNVTPGSAPLMNEPLNSTALPVGFHIVTVRTIDGLGERSVPFTAGFTRNGGLISGYEYWLDDVVADRITEDIGPGATVDLIDALPVPTTEGDHLFTIRFRDTDGDWSVPLSSTFSFTVGLNEIPGVSNYLLFPNPVSDQLSLRVDAMDATVLHVQVLDASGRTALAFENWSASGRAHHSWDIASLARGTYLLRITSADRSIHLPFVKQ
jgi:hypothetical protein